MTNKIEKCWIFKIQNLVSTLKYNYFIVIKKYS